MTAEEIHQAIMETGVRNVTLTGGEPFGPAVYFRITGETGRRSFAACGDRNKRQCQSGSFCEYPQQAVFYNGL